MQLAVRAEGFMLPYHRASRLLLGKNLILRFKVRDLGDYAVAIRRQRAIDPPRNTTTADSETGFERG